MSKSKLRSKRLSTFLLFALISIVLLNAPIFSIIDVKAQQPETTVKIVPSERTVEPEFEVLPTAPFTHNITVSNVTDLYAWQIRIRFFPSILNWTDAIYPAGHVFEGQDVAEVIALQEDLTKTFSNITAVNLANPNATDWKVGTTEYTLTKWVDTDNSGDLTTSDIVWLKLTETIFYKVQAISTEGSTIQLTAESAYMQYGLTLQGLEPTFNSTDGATLLAQVTFTGIGPGVTPLNFSEVDTFLLDSTLGDISFSTENSIVTVLGEVPTGESSTISIEVDPSSVQVGSNVTISGIIDPSKPGVSVTISYKLGDGTWTTLTTVTTDSNSRYTHIWTTSTIGTYKLEAKWQGDETHLPAQSVEKTVTVSTEPPPSDTTDYVPYIIIIGVIAVAIILVAIYFIKIRRS